MLFNRFLSCFVVIVLLMGFAQYVGAQPSVPAPKDPQGSEPPPTARPSVSVAPAADDLAIARRLNSILDSTGWFNNAGVMVREGIVFLDGTTATQEHRQWAADLAGNTQDVVAVVNWIDVVSDVGSTLTRAGEEIREFYLQSIRAWPILLLAFLILLASWLASKVVSWASERFFASRVRSPLLRTVMTRAISIPVLLLGVYFILQVAGLTRLAITVLGGTGLIGIIIGFAFRDIAENFLASLLLSVRNPFRSGDLVQIAGYTGIVQNLNTRSTILLTLDGSNVQIPNATVYKSTIENFSSSPTRRATFTIGIGYESSTAKAQKLISEVLRAHAAVLPSPESLVLVEELGAATVNLRVSYWYDSAIHSPAKISSALLRQTKNVLMAGGIELPDPAREVVFPKGVAVTMFDSNANPAPADREKSQDAPKFALQPDDSSDSTLGEGDLFNETPEIRNKASGNIAEAREDLLNE